MPRTFGRNQLHMSQVLGWCVRDAPLVEVEGCLSALGEAGCVGRASAAEIKPRTCSVAWVTTPKTTDKTAANATLCESAADMGLSPSARALASRLAVAGSVLSLMTE